MWKKLKSVGKVKYGLTQAFHTINVVILVFAFKLWCLHPLRNRKWYNSSNKSFLGESKVF